MNRPQFGTDGVRGTFGENLTVDFVFCLGQAIARVLGTDIEFLIGRDTRTSGPTLQLALTRGLESEGTKTKNIGVLSTPGVATIARRDLKRSCVLTASHNRAADNGIKVFDVGGVKIDENQEKKIEEELDKLLLQVVDSDTSGTLPEADFIETKDYVGYLIDSLGETSLEGIKVVLDCANGAAFSIAPSVFLLGGAQVVAIHTESDGVRINENCGATHLSDLVEQVVSHRADIGFAFDGDADRVIVVDNKGIVRDGDAILALFAIDMAAKNLLNKKTVVATSMSNGGLKKFLKNNSMELVETQVGDKFVLQAMLDNEYSLGGEQSGHIIRTDFATWGDGILNALQITKILVELKNLGPEVSSSKMLSLFEPMVQLHNKVHVKSKKKAEQNDEINTSINTELLLLGQDSRIIIRPSGTEEVVRITVEGLDEKDVNDSVARLSEVVKKVCG